MKKAIIFLHGDLADISRAKDYVEDDDLIICADGGVEYALKVSCMPDIVIGDLDSISKESESKLKRQKVEFIRYPKDKDESDGELAVDYAVKRGYKKIIIFGLLGRRVDHVISNLFLPLAFKDKDIDICYFDGNQEIFIIGESAEIKGKVGDRLSLIPVLGDVMGVATEGLKFPLKDETLRLGFSRGISNIFINRLVKVTFQKGCLLAIHSRD